MRLLAILLVIGCERHVDTARTPVCPGTTPWPATAKLCTQDRDCPKDQRCWADGLPDYSHMCGAYTPPKHDCTQDADCGSGQICEEAGPGPCDGVNLVCAPRCTEHSCKPDERCGSKGHCEPTPCSAGFACAAGWQCTNSDRADPHGCSQRPCWNGGSCGPNERCVKDQGCTLRECLRSADCECGACIDGTCRMRPGVCDMATPPGPPP